MKKLALLALLLGCSETAPLTEALVVVDSDLSAGTELSELRVRVFDEDDRALSDQRLTLVARSGRANAYTLPVSFSLTPGETGDSSRFRLAVTGRARVDDELGDVVERQVVSSFRAGTRTVVEVYLQASCRAQLCREPDEDPGAQSCLDGACVDVPTQKTQVAAAGELGGYKPTRADRDASASECSADDDCGARLGTLSPEGCAIGRCRSGRCQYVAQDADGDGHGTDRCESDQVEVELGDDCDDLDPRRSPGAWDGPAVPDQHPDTCDELDNDCDGTADDERPEGKTCECDPINDLDVPCSQRADGSAIEWPAGTPVGICRYGKRSCTKEGVWGSCTGAIEPRGTDSCNIADDDSDCDGQRNEDCPCVTGSQQACGSDVGNCETGTQTCDDGKWGACTGQVVAKTKDSCDKGDDANCNGTVNEGCTCANGDTATCKDAVNALGVCGTRRTTCKEGKWDRTLCLPAAVETCNDDGKDEDCDGAINERPECECTTGRSVRCSAFGAQGTCGEGYVPCVGGKLGSCDTMPAAGDTCAFLNDDNCDGVINDGCLCGEGDVQSCMMDGCSGIQFCNETGAWDGCSTLSCQ
ncbi:MAG: putative metal-binding motif-containing protein [Polyangiales bacterium]